MTTLDPSTGRPLPPTAIQRALFTAQKVHVYAVPPIQSTRGFNAGPWTAPPAPTAKQIFTARLRVLETSIDNAVTVALVLEDPTSGELFAAAAYGNAAVVQAALDSSRFFAVLVTGEGGRRATLGIGFEERGEAVDFGIALAEARKVLGLEQGERQQAKVEEPKGGFGLKEGESIVIELGGKGRRVREREGDKDEDDKALFSIAPPPSAADVKKQAADLGFDDGEFGEFQ